jgi:MYXO-CTERM domain-containing protein
MICRRLVFTASLCFVPSIATAHVALTDPVPRSGENGLTMAPCGGVAAGAPTAFMAGETISVSWAVGQAHGGSLTIDLAPADDTGFDMYVLATDVSDADGMPTSMDVQLPDIDCDACTLRLSQVNPSRDNYYSCADISLSGASAGSTESGSSSGGSEGSGSSEGGTTDGGSADGTGTGASAGDGSSEGSASGSATATGASASATTTATAGGESSGETSAANDDSGSSGCSCSSSTTSSGWWLLAIAGLAMRRRRR